MTKEEKIIEILDKHYGYHVNQGSDVWFTNGYQDRFAHLLEMAEWKEQQMIEKSCEWLQKHAEEFMPASYSLQKYQTNRLLYYFKKEMKE